MTLAGSRSVGARPSGRVIVDARPAGGTALRGRSSRLANGDLPWQPRDAVRVSSLILLGIVGLGVCWYGISGEVDMNSQLPWLVGACAALVVAGVGMVGWLLAGLREVHRVTHEVVAAIRTDLLHQQVVLDDEFDLAPARDAVPQAPAHYVIGSGMTHAHRDDCLLVRGKVTTSISPVEIDRRGLTYCGVCGG